MPTKTEHLELRVAAMVRGEVDGADFLEVDVADQEEPPEVDAARPEADVEHLAVVVDSMRTDRSVDSTANQKTRKSPSMIKFPNFTIQYNRVYQWCASEFTF